jgi:uncharacterized MAPEG superfamily protein
MTAVTALLLFAAWTLVLMMAYVGPRVFLTLTLKKKANSWPRDGADGNESAFIKRAHHAHLNCVENLPVFAAIVLAAVVTGKGAQADMIAPWVLYLRVAQSVTHLIGTSAILVFVRANFFLLQAIAMAYLIFRLVA